MIIMRFSPIVFISFFLFSCSLNDDVDCFLYNRKPICSTKAYETNNNQKLERKDYKVSENAARLYLHYVEHGRPAAWTVTPYISDNDTIFYIFNSSKGWKIISGDTRTPPVLAENGIGNIILSDTLDMPLRIVLEDAKSYIQFMRSQICDTTNCASKIWDPLTNISEKKYLSKLNNRNPDFHWVKVLISSNSTTTNIEDTGHLLSTTWDQDSPWNSKVPILSGHSDHCKVGCVAVALPL